MPYESLHIASCTIDINCIEDALSGDNAARKFIEQYGKFNRKFLRSLVKPFRPDPYGDGRSWFCPWTSDSVRVLPSSNVKELRRPDRDRRVYREWEQVLAKFNLSDDQINASTEKQTVIIPTYHTPPLKNTDTDKQLQARHGLAWNSCHALPIQVHEREVPPWTANDEQCRAYLLHLFPGAFEHRGPAYAKMAQRSRTRAGKIAYVLTRWFRECATAEEIAEDFGIPVGHVIQVAGAIRNHHWLNGSTKACCKRWWKGHPRPIPESCTRSDTSLQHDVAIPSEPLSLNLVKQD